jgi:hypothetical protein
LVGEGDIGEGEVDGVARKDQAGGDGGVVVVLDGQRVVATGAQTLGAVLAIEATIAPAALDLAVCTERKKQETRAAGGSAWATHWQAAKGSVVGWKNLKEPGNVET